MKEIEFLSSQEISKIIDQLKHREKWPIFNGRNLAQYNSEMNEIISSITKFQLFPYLKPEPNKVIPLTLYRVRKKSEVVNRNLRTEFSYPPIAFTKSNLRANLIGNPVFYASNSLVTAILEYIKANNNQYVGEEVYISKWSLKLTSNHFVTNYISRNLKGHNVFSDLSEINEKSISNWGLNISKDQLEGINLLKDFFSEVFLTDSLRSISSYLAHKVIYSSPYFEGILIYPSKATKDYQVNFAIHPNIVDEHMELNRIYDVVIRDLVEQDEFNFTFELTTNNIFGYYDRKKLYWIDSHENEEIFKDEFCKDFKTQDTI